MQRGILMCRAEQGLYSRARQSGWLHLFEIPLICGVISALVAPQLAALGAIAALSEGFSYYRENQNAGLLATLRFYLFLPAEIWNFLKQGRGKPLLTVGKAPIDQRGKSTYSILTMLRSAFINRRKYNERRYSSG